ncbi:MAG: 4Fe-4S binding protein [Candidatus Alcyoniella australis]|nr:4Fe-4S binding protein [Candidatus Alcyoniella australis]
MAKLPGWKDLSLGIAITDAGNAKEYRTGDWRSMRPVTDESKCISCGWCWLLCPDHSRQPFPRKSPKADCPFDDFYDVDEYYCKGCGICAAECPTGAIKMVPEVGQ